MCLINNYKYSSEEIKVYVGEIYFKEHQKILNGCKFPKCQLLIKKDMYYQNKFEKTESVTLFCNFVRTKDQFIYIKAYSVEYLDVLGKKMSDKIQWIEEME